MGCGASSEKHVAVAAHSEDGPKKPETAKIVEEVKDVQEDFENIDVKANVERDLTT
jgi:hypothetical protein